MSAATAPIDIPAIGTVLKRETVAIAQIVSLTPPGSEVGEREATTLDDVIKIKKPTLTDAGELTFNILFDPKYAAHTALADEAAAPALLLAPGAYPAYSIEFNDGSGATSPSKCDFKGWVKSFKPGAVEIEGSLTAEVTVVVTELPVFTART